MFGKVKRWLGIEGVKVELVLPDQVLAKSGVIEGKLRFFSMHTQTVKSVKVILTEKYTRGRWKNKLADLYKLAEIELKEDIIVPADEALEVDFELPFTLVKSDIDEFGDKNFIFQNVVNAAKLIKNVKSEYTMEVEAVVDGTALPPFDKQVVNIV